MEIAFDLYDTAYNSLYVVFNAGRHCMRLLKLFLHEEGLDINYLFFTWAITMGQIGD